MKDLDPDHDLNSVLQLFLAPDLQRLPDALDRDFVIFGLEDGLFIHANAETFLFFLRQMRPERGENRKLPGLTAGAGLPPPVSCRPKRERNGQPI